MNTNPTTTAEDREIARQAMKERGQSYAAVFSVDELTALLASVRAAADKAGVLRGPLESAAKQFRHYENLHRSKGTHDGDEKALVNGNFAEMCEAALRQPLPPQGEG